VLRHVVCLTVRAGTPDAAVADLVAALRTLPGLIPEIRRYDVGADLGLADGNADIVILAEFDDADAWRRYQAHPAHTRVITELVRPIVEHRLASQVEV
jgi:hypothetical protein